MINIFSMPVGHMAPWVAEQCRVLCNDGSEMQALFYRVCYGSLRMEDHGTLVAYAWQVLDDDAMLAYACGDPGADPACEVVGWVCLSEWKVNGEGRVQVQGYVKHGHRGSGIAFALCAVMTHLMPKDQLPVAVFSPEFTRIAKRLGWQATEYKLVDDGWIGVGTVERRDIRTRADEK